MIVMQLAFTFYECPRVWQNLINSLELVIDRKVSAKLINEVLAPFDAVYVDSTMLYSNGDGHVEFENEAGRLMFLLKYS
jgi:hypothetical protein